MSGKLGMSPRIDRTGDHFGPLEVLKRLPGYPTFGRLEYRLSLAMTAKSAIIKE